MCGEKFVGLQHPHADINDLVVLSCDCHQAEPMLCRYGMQGLVQRLAIIGGAIVFGYKGNGFSVTALYAVVCDTPRLLAICE